MGANKKIVMLRSVVAHSASDYYARGMEKLDVELVEIPFHPHEKQPERNFPEADLLVMVDCGLPVEFPGLEGYKCPKGYVSIDSCHKLSIHKAYAEKCQFDYVWVAQKHVADEFGTSGRWLPLAAEETVHAFRPEMAATDGLWHRIRYRSFYDIGMCGAPYPHRRKFEKLFRQAGLNTNFYFRKRFGEQATREVARCTLGFNVGAGFSGTKGKDIPMRVFETMANGQAMLLTNTYDDLGYEEMFQEGKHYVGFRSEEEAVDKALYYARHPLEAIEIAREGQAHILARHTYAHRCREILDTLD